jgi:formylglycine-generating enzyme required for sulfatase activity
MNFRCRWLVVAVLAAMLGTWRVEAAEPPKAENATPQALRVPDGFRAVPGTVIEPYTKTGWAKEVIHEKTGIEMVFIPAGEFMMGSPGNEKGREPNEGPQHKVKITKPFYMGKYEVTQAQWQQVMGKNPSYFKDSDKLPVERVSWNDCQEFVKKVGAMIGQRVCRLPTEAEWEYACRAGTTTRFYSGDDDGGLDTIAWYDRNSGNKPHEGGGKAANAFGLYDMSGNVWEWCSDWHADSYANAQEKDPTGPGTGTSRVLRGGSWNFIPLFFRSAYRYGYAPVIRHSYFGFRVAVDLK